MPEEVLLGADEIELVDMSPHALRQRMKHGNVYPPERTQIALEKFFTEANLTALRELALRLVAQRVEGQLEDTTAGVQLPLVTDRVLVLVDGSPAAARAIRKAAKLASALHGILIAVVVDTPASDSLPFDRARDLKEAIDDASDLGADVVRVEAPDVAAGLERVATARRATRIVLPHQALTGLRRLRERPLVDELLERLPEVEIDSVGAPRNGRA
jgi:two-component system sensor histidine kinase KdpD